MNEGYTLTIFGLTGLPGSGKSEIARMVAETGCPVVRMGDMVRDHVLALGLPLEPDVVGRIAHERRQAEGMDIWARVTAHHIRERTEGSGSPLFPRSSPGTCRLMIIDGIRNHEEVDRFRAEFAGFRVIAVHASPGVRYRRIMSREREDDTRGYEAFIHREERELGWGIARVIVHADLMIVNEGTMDDLEDQVRRIL